jgi:alkaline phosphatase
VAAAGVASVASGALGTDTHGSSHRQAKNIIFLLGDGMGTQEITAAANTRAYTTS